MVRVKICGIKSAEDARAAIVAGADALGFIFSPGPRQVDPEIARDIIMELPPFVSVVGVFVNEPKYAVQELATFCRLDVLQFHGQETPKLCEGYSQQVIKAFRMKDAGVLEAVSKYRVNAYLFDTYVPGSYGGSGQSFDWRMLADFQANKPVILAGGLTENNVAEAIRTVRPYAVDVSSGVETGGRKDPEKIKRFIQEVRRACHELT